MKTVIDINKYSEVTDWDALKKASPFLLFTGTRGIDYVSPKLKTYINACEAHKIPYWIWTYLNKGDEASQAEFLVETLKDLVGDRFVGCVLDAEEENDPDDILAALDVVKKFSAKNMLYTMYSQYSIVKPAVLARGSDVAWWEARYGRDTGVYNQRYAPHSGAELHQFTTVAEVPYVGNTVDMSRLTGKGNLNWFITPVKNEKKEGPDVVNKLAKNLAFPPRGYFKLGDGYKQYTQYSNQVKKVQEIVNDFGFGQKLLVDGEYGKKTRAGVEALQSMLNVTIDGYFGPKTLEAACKMASK